MVLEIATTLGALTGGITAVLLSPNLLEGLFAAVLVSVVYSMRRLPKSEGLVTTGVLDTSYVDPASGQTLTYGVRNLPLGMGASFLAGNVSGLLGIGGGIIKVPMMSLVMGVPLRAAIATSNLMIGVTAATSALIYYQRGFLDPGIAILTALGVLLGRRSAHASAARCAACGSSGSSRGCCWSSRCRCSIRRWRDEQEHEHKPDVGDRVAVAEPVAGATPGAEGAQPGLSPHLPTTDGPVVALNLICLMRRSWLHRAQRRSPTGRRCGSRRMCSTSSRSPRRPEVTGDRA